MGLRAAVVIVAAITVGTASGAIPGEGQLRLREFDVPSGTRPHDVAPARDGGVWFTAQGSGQLGWLNPKNGRVRLTRLGEGSAPHGVIVGPDGAPWITDGGLNAIVRVDPRTRKVRVFPLPASAGYANLNTATFDGRGVLWFTGQSGIYGRLDPSIGRVRVFRAPRGAGPYGVTTRDAPPSSSRRRKTKGRVAPGRTPAGVCGSANGTRAGSGCTTRGPSGGASGACRGRTR